MSDPLTFAGTAIGIKKIGMGVVGMVAMDIKDSAKMWHLIAGTIIGVITASVVLTSFAESVRHDADSAHKLSRENHQSISGLAESMHIHVLSAEKRLGRIEASIEVIKVQNRTILSAVKSHDSRK